MSTLYHYKIAYDPAFNDRYEAICKRLFGEHTCLVVLEKRDINAHCHIQGYSDLAESTFKKLISDLHADHYKYKIDGARPLKRAKRDVTVEGFQYMCKEDPPTILYKQNLSDEDIKKMHDKSDQHVEELKETFRLYIQTRPEVEALIGTTRYGDLLDEAVLAGGDYYEGKGCQPPPQFRKMVIWALWTACKDRAHRIYFGHLL